MWCILSELQWYRESYFCRWIACFISVKSNHKRWFSNLSRKWLNVNRMVLLYVTHPGAWTGRKKTVRIKIKLKVIGLDCWIWRPCHEKWDTMTKHMLQDHCVASVDRIYAWECFMSHQLMLFVRTIQINILMLPCNILDEWTLFVFFW